MLHIFKVVLELLEGSRNLLGQVSSEFRRSPKFLVCFTTLKQSIYYVLPLSFQVFIENLSK